MRAILHSLFTLIRNLSSYFQQIAFFSSLKTVILPGGKKKCFKEKKMYSLLEIREIKIGEEKEIDMPTVSFV